MSEAEFDRLLDAVRTAVAPSTGEDFQIEPPYLDLPPKPANDNQMLWPLLPFPEGWNAAC